MRANAAAAVAVAAVAAALTGASGCGGATAAGGPGGAAGPSGGAGGAGAAGGAGEARAEDRAVSACRAAANGLERGTRSLRPPDASVRDPARRLCLADEWPAAAVDCFAKMDEGGFGRCAAMLPKRPQRRLLDRIAGGAGERVAVVDALAQIATLQVGIAECDEFIEVVARVLVCDAMAIETRAQLGAEMADFWALPTSGLPADAQLRMADVCVRSTILLAQRAQDAGCAP